MRPRGALREYLRGSLSVLPVLGALVAVLAGSLLSLVDVGPRFPLAFQGTADDARALLTGIVSTMVTVIAVLLGLTVVALQMASTQFSPRLLRNFLRDRPNQLVLAVFVGTFVYSAAGLFTVGVSAGERTGDYPRLAVTGAIALMFASLTLLVFFANHLAHSIQIDTIMRTIEGHTLAVIRGGLLPGGGAVPTVPTVPNRATPVAARRSGYVQVVDVAGLLAQAGRRRVTVRLRPRVGDHVVAGTTLAWVWTDGAGARTSDGVEFEPILDETVRIGFERTFEQDAGFGCRQLVDIACKALSSAINDPYTAIQAIDHLAVVFSALATAPVGDHVAHAAGGTVVVPGRRFGSYLALGCGLIRRCGMREPTVAHAMLRMLTACAARSADEPDRFTAIRHEAELIVADCDRAGHRTGDLAEVHAEARSLQALLGARMAASATRGAATTSPGPAPG
ncbi:DUF2254 domain-containing protein [Pseudonocardia asaccharolytica]|uniref:DUF2254 domain-containing protein n=1 Tax=Pseudonocardia asaccharolytica DSM 44247 = NBRC 16224 TaxID=1123024 RepID=A0A511D144_9PSEU|nr:DUF2254 domain-containing protein [Pseudonocardia asaccharolytica]GEL18481.1 hypothetical protein PA7_23180 [Pseudonocardia asaccharolytica DSM 44247 = NBRC 16224]